MSLTDTSHQEQRVCVAEHFWAVRGGPYGDHPEQDWYEAESFLRRPWVEARLGRGFPLPHVLWENDYRKRLAQDERQERQFLAIEAEVAPDALAAWLEESAGADARPAATLLVALDGSPEYGREAFRRHSHNCVSPLAVMEGKDGRFFRHCARTFALHGGAILGPTRQEGGGRKPSPQQRPFQDGAAVIFTRTTDAIEAALQLCRDLTARNEAEELPWQRRFHPRVAIAPTWREAINCLTYCWRGEIVLAPASWPKCSGQEHPTLAAGLLLAAGVRAGPREKDRPLHQVVANLAEKIRAGTIPGKGHACGGRQTVSAAGGGASGR
jgi:hypothetical protein